MRHGCDGPSTVRQSGLLRKRVVLQKAARSDGRRYPRPHLVCEVMAKLSWIFSNVKHQRRIGQTPRHVVGFLEYRVSQRLLLWPNDPLLVDETVMEDGANIYTASPVTCGGEFTCKTNSDHVVGCVSGTISPFFTACLDYSAFKAGSCSNLDAATGCW